jgi:hypothetical protein
MAEGKRSHQDRKAGRDTKLSGQGRIPPEEAQPYRVRFYSNTINPYTAAEIKEILGSNKPGDVFHVDPNRLRAMHAGISDAFSNGTKIDDTVAELRKPGAKQLPTINVAAVEVPLRKWEEPAEPGGGATELMLFTEDHRRVVAARLSGVKLIKATMKAEPSVVGNFTTKNKGLRVEVRSYRVADEGKHQGGNKSTFPSSGRLYRAVDDDE